MRKNLEIRRSLSLILVFFFSLSTLGPLPAAQAADDFSLPTPGVMVHLSPPLDPPLLKGIKVHPDNPFRFDFILNKGDNFLADDQLKSESTKLIKYFLASLTIPEKDLWVNLSPYEKDRIIPQGFGFTGMGRDLLAEDYMLKQITASLIYPEDQIGKKFWKRIYEEASKKFGTTNIPVNTFNKVWIVPDKAVVYENAQEGTAYVVDSKLKVMLEEDYLSLEKHEGINHADGKQTDQIGNQIVREIVIPELTREVNENKNFAKVRQVYNSLILATWYKEKIKNSILTQVYADKNKVAGINVDDPQEKERIYQWYLQAFKKGVYNYIKEEQDPLTQEMIPRKYFSGGFNMAMRVEVSRDSAMLDKIPIDRAMVLKVALKFAKNVLSSSVDKLDAGIVRRAQNIEYKKISNIPIIENQEDRDNRIKNGKLINIDPILHEINSEGQLKFVLDPEKKVSPYADPLLVAGFDEYIGRVNVALETALKAKGIKSSSLSELPEIKITDLSRTIEEQKEIVAKGLPAAEGNRSAHLRGLAIDLSFRNLINASFYDKTKIEQSDLTKLIMRTFDEVAVEMEKEGNAHHIWEYRISMPDTVKGLMGLKEGPYRPVMHFMIMPTYKVMENIEKPTVEPQKTDKAMVEKNGGIDLTPENMNLQMQNNGGPIKFSFDPAQLEQLRSTPGFVPVIISIQPMMNLRSFLGLTEEKNTLEVPVAG